MAQCKPNSIADQVQKKLHYTLRVYCELRDLAYNSLSQGYVSVEARIVLESDGIDVDLGIDSIKKGKSI